MELDEQLKTWSKLTSEELKEKYEAYMDCDTRNGIPFSHLIELRDNNYISQEVYEYIIS